MKAIIPLVVSILVCACHSRVISRDAVSRADKRIMMRDSSESKRTDADRAVDERDEVKRADIKRKDTDIGDTPRDYAGRDDHPHDRSDSQGGDSDRFNGRRGEVRRDAADRNDARREDAGRNDRGRDFDIIDARRDDADRREDAKRHDQHDNARIDDSWIPVDDDGLSQELDANLDALFDIQDQISKDTLSKRGKACMFIGQIIEDGKTKIFKFRGHSITVKCRNGNHIYVL